MAKRVAAWQYMAFGVLWVVYGTWIVLATVLTRSPAWPIDAALSSALVAGGGYWLWRFPRARRIEQDGGGVPLQTK